MHFLRNPHNHKYDLINHMKKILSEEKNYADKWWTDPKSSGLWQVEVCLNHLDIIKVEIPVNRSGWTATRKNPISWHFPLFSSYLSVRSPLCRLKSREGTILSMCWGSQMLACSSSFTVFLTTPCRPLIPAMRILAETVADIRNHPTGNWIY